MTNFVAAFFDPMLDTGGETAVSASLHTSLPDSSGSNEVDGGAYSRQSVTWSDASDGTLTASSGVTFSVPSETTVSHVGFWGSGGTWKGSARLNEPQPFPSSGTLTIDPLTISLENTE